MSDINKCQSELLNEAEKKGYLTFDDIMNASDAYSLSIMEVDNLSEALQLRGILVYEEEPTIQSVEQLSEEVVDYSRTDYDSIYEEILDLTPQLESFLNEVKRYPAPQYGEVSQLIRQINEGNGFARERVITLFARGVLKIALSMTKQYELDLEEAISSGFIGLMNAVEKFDPDGFSVFHSYASLWIQQSIQRECNPTWMDYYYPAHFKDRMFRCLQRLKECSGGEISDKDQYNEVISRISLETDLPIKEVNKALNHVHIQKKGKKSYEEFIELEEPNIDNLPLDLIVFEDEAFSEVNQRQITSIIEELLSTLSSKEALVIRLRFGLTGHEAMTLEEIGSILNVTRERIRQIEAKAMRKLSHPQRSVLLRDYW